MQRFLTFFALFFTIIAGPATASEMDRFAANWKGIWTDGANASNSGDVSLDLDGWSKSFVIVDSDSAQTRYTMQMSSRTINAEGHLVIVSANGQRTDTLRLENKDKRPLFNADGTLAIPADEVEPVLRGSYNFNNGQLTGTVFLKPEDNEERQAIVAALTGETGGDQVVPTSGTPIDNNR